MKLQTTILFLLFTACVFAQKSRFSEGETIYVWAEKGLNMRKLPDAKSEKIAALPYGEKVIVQANIGIIVAHEVEEFKDFKVHGVWLLVKYGDKEGFVFDGYLSRLVAPVKSEKQTKDRAFDILLKYLDGQVGRENKYIFKINQNGKKIKVSDTDYKNGNYELNEGEALEITYKAGVIYQIDYNEKAHLGAISFPNLTLYEGYVISKVIYKGYKIDYNKQLMQFNTNDAWNAGCEHTIFLKKGKLIISVICSC